MGRPPSGLHLVPMSESERVACKACGKWMFHLAKTCPHCGAPQEAKQAAPAAKVEATVKPKVELKLSPEEARSLLAATPTGGSGVSFTDVALEIIWPRVGALELALSIVAERKGKNRSARDKSIGSIASSSK